MLTEQQIREILSRPVHIECSANKKKFTLITVPVDHYAKPNQTINNHKPGISNFARDCCRGFCFNPIPRQDSAYDEIKKAVSNTTYSVKARGENLKLFKAYCANKVIGAVTSSVRKKIQDSADLVKIGIQRATDFYWYDPLGDTENSMGSECSVSLYFYDAKSKNTLKVTFRAVIPVYEIQTVEKENSIRTLAEKMIESSEAQKSSKESVLENFHVRTVTLCRAAKEITTPYFNYKSYLGWDSQKVNFILPSTPEGDPDYDSIKRYMQNYLFTKHTLMNCSESEKPREQFYTKIRELIKEQTGEAYIQFKSVELVCADLVIGNNCFNFELTVNATYSVDKGTCTEKDKVVFGDYTFSRTNVEQKEEDVTKTKTLRFNMFPSSIMFGKVTFLVVSKEEYYSLYSLRKFDTEKKTIFSACLENKHLVFDDSSSEQVALLSMHDKAVNKNIPVDLDKNNKSFLSIFPSDVTLWNQKTMGVGALPGRSTHYEPVYVLTVGSVNASVKIELKVSLLNNLNKKTTSDFDYNVISDSITLSLTDKKCFGGLNMAATAKAFVNPLL